MLIEKMDVVLFEEGIPLSHISTQTVTCKWKSQLFYKLEYKNDNEKSSHDF